MPMDQSPDEKTAMPPSSIGAEVRDTGDRRRDCGQTFEIFPDGAGSGGVVDSSGATAPIATVACDSQPFDEPGKVVVYRCMDAAANATECTLCFHCLFSLALPLGQCMQCVSRHHLRNQKLNEIQTRIMAFPSQISSRNSAQTVPPPILISIQRR